MNNFTRINLLHGRIPIKQRILTGAIALPVLILLLLYIEHPWLVLFLSLVNFLALREFHAMALPATERHAERLFGSFLGVALLLILTMAPAQTLPVWLAAFFLLLGSWYLFRFQQLETVARDLALSLMGLFYVPCLLAHIVFLFELPSGRQWIFLVLLVVMAADSTAYFVGSMIGRTKLYPAISPNKSWEGSIGGVVGSLLAALLAKYWFFPELGGGDVLLAGFLLSVSGQIGDLFESLLKRSFGVKDSGGLIPGHGGLLDRLDSLLFAFPAAFFYAVLIF